LLHSCHFSQQREFAGFDMVDLAKLLHNTERYSNYTDVTREPTSRLPYALFGPSIVTHLPLYYKSHEDDNFESRASALQKYVTDHANSRLALSDEIRADIIDTTQRALSKIIKDNDCPSSQDLQEAIQFVWYACRLALEQVVNSQPELLIFQANTRIKLEINRFAHSAVIHAISRDDNGSFRSFDDIISVLSPKFTPHGWAKPSNPWLDEKLSAQAFRVTNQTVFRFTYELIGASTLRAAKSKPSRDGEQLKLFPQENQPRMTLSDLAFLQRFKIESPFKPRTEPEIKAQERLGGLISWFDAEYSMKKYYDAGRQVGKHLVGSVGANRKFFPTSGPKWRSAASEIEPVFDDYVLWRRGDRNWRYTFFDSSYDYLESRTPKLGTFIASLLQSLDLVHSFGDALNKDVALDLYPFPGSRISGAQYFVIPAELLLLTAANLSPLVARYCDDPHKERLAGNMRLHFTSANNRSFKQCLETLDELERLMRSATSGAAKPVESATGIGSRNRRATDKKAPNQQSAGHDLADRSSEKPLSELVFVNDVAEAALQKAAKNLRDRLRPVYQWVSDAVTKQTDEARYWQQRFLSCFVEISEILWKTIYATDVHTLGQDDFVSSSVIDGRAIYFSNFRPFETDPTRGAFGFTRTFFIDFQLMPYQCGRLVRRLCDVATYRMSCVKDNNRLQALSDGVSQLNEDFNLLVPILLVPGTDAHGAGSAAVLAPRSEQELADALDDALDLYQRALEFNKFITEGVSGRNSAAQSDWEMVGKQVVDIRETRLPGHALLGEFLERGVAVSMLELSQTTARYENLVSRISSHLSTIRTLLAHARSASLAKVLNASVDVLKGSQDQYKLQTTLLEQTNKLLEATRAHSDEQTALLRAADLLVWLGGTYYFWSLTKDVMVGAFGLERFRPEWRVDLYIVPVDLVIVAVLVYGFQKKRREIAAYFARGKTLFVDRMKRLLRRRGSAGKPD
jgi:hypothetical protein